jgi:tRNA A37 N6-isopentenylltransferase MiaA
MASHSQYLYMQRRVDGLKAKLSDEIQRRRRQDAEIARLRKALEEIAQPDAVRGQRLGPNAMRRLARAALKEP